MSLPPNCPGADKAHTSEFYINTLKQIIDSGLPYDSVCFKDASGTSTPKTIYETIKGAKVIFHSHDTAVHVWHAILPRLMPVLMDWIYLWLRFPVVPRRVM